MRLLPLLFSLSALLFFGCGEDDTDTPPIENGIIIVNTLNLTVSGGPQGSQTFTYFQPPPVDMMTQAPEVDELTLSPNTNYTYRFSVSGSDNLGTRNYNEEIEDNGEDFLFTFDVLAANLTMTPNDTDALGEPIGLTGTIQTGAASGGVLMFKFFFEADKTNPATTGTRIIAGDFPIAIQ